MRHRDIRIADVCRLWVEYEAGGGDHVVLRDRLNEIATVILGESGVDELRKLINIELEKTR